MTAAVTVNKLSQQYGEVTALNEISVSIEEGEIFVLIGPNGAGKTSFVRTVSGTLEPTAGNVSVFGSPPAMVDKDRLGVLPQSFQPPERLTPTEIVTYYSRLYHDSRSPNRVLADVGIDERSDRWFERLSGGQQRRVCLATALINDPELLVLDEPTTGIDPAGQEQLWGLLRELRAEGHTVLLTTHDMQEATELADRVGLLAGGTLLAVDTPSALIEKFGGTGRVTCTGVSSVSRTALESLGVEWTHENHQLTIESVTSNQLPTVIQSLEQLDLDYQSLTWEQPGLKDVFLAMETGDTPNDE